MKCRHSACPCVLAEISRLMEENEKLLVALTDWELLNTDIEGEIN